jgi:hypothetical protein
MRGLPLKVKHALEKARDSALLAVEVYNKPAVKFKSGGFITLMMIAWTALFHAIFYKKKRKPFHKEHGRFVKIQNDFKHWELAECLSQYYKAETGDPVRKNLEFFIPLRNQIEHRSMPELDATIFGECQAMLLNFDEMLQKEFGARYCLRESLSFAVQLFPSSETLVEAVKQNPATKSVSQFIERYRSAISADVQASGKYSFKAFLIQVANHTSTDTLPVQFIHYDKLTEAQRQDIGRFVALVKTQHVPVSNEDMMKPADVVKRVQTALGDPKITRGTKQVNRFNENIHAKCWRFFKVRPSGKSQLPSDTTAKYCVYDKPHKDYLYTQAWVDFLVEKLKDDAFFLTLYKRPVEDATTPVPGVPVTT